MYRSGFIERVTLYAPGRCQRRRFNRATTLSLVAVESADRTTGGVLATVTSRTLTTYCQRPEALRYLGLAHVGAGRNPSLWHCTLVGHT